MPAIMNSMDFANMQFETIGLKEMVDLISDPSSNFTAMVFGKPKMGKSYLCIDLEPVTWQEIMVRFCM